MPELKPALHFLLQAFESDAEAEWCRGLQSWLSGLRGDLAARSLAWPSGLLADEAYLTSIDRRHAPPASRRAPDRPLIGQTFPDEA